MVRNHLSNVMLLFCANLPHMCHLRWISHHLGIYLDLADPDPSNLSPIDMIIGAHYMTLSYFLMFVQVPLGLRLLKTLYWDGYCLESLWYLTLHHPSLLIYIIVLSFKNYQTGKAKVLGSWSTSKSTSVLRRRTNMWKSFYTNASSRFKWTVHCETAV